MDNETREQINALQIAIRTLAAEVQRIKYEMIRLPDKEDFNSTLDYL